MIQKVSCYPKPCKVKEAVHLIAFNVVTKGLQVFEFSLYDAYLTDPVSILSGRRSIPHPYGYFVPLLQQPSHQPRAEKPRSSGYETAHWLVTSCRLSTT